MESYQQQSCHQSYGGMDRPLFGESNKKDKYCNYVLGAATIIAVLATVISAFVHLVALNIVFSGAIVMNCISNIFLIYWYRQGDLDPKFRNLIYYNSLVTLLLCVIAFVTFFKK
ncbi:transmembrane protein 243 [Hydra vulgaris]|uniref:Transmembrane protein 243-like isoform X1 n=1 Tax=Hydra vulgaris TaxID=6087 RepID=T2M6U4_HYDVU|nr:transmembrane protein 243 isoform X1 [Hydra vulgaris]